MSRWGQDRILDLWTLFAYGRGLAALYAACGLMGIGTCRSGEPWSAPDMAQQQSIESVLRRHAVLVDAPAGTR
jgi:hypothetical protein